MILDSNIASAIVKDFDYKTLCKVATVCKVITFNY